MAGICVLLVEDDLVTRRIVSNYLKTCSYEVIEACNGRVALEVLEGPHGHSIDIVLTDNVMPEVTGLELIVKLVQGRRWQHLPVIIMSSEMREDVVQQAMDAGACDFLHKPVKRTEINGLWKHARKGGAKQRDMSHDWARSVEAPSQSAKEGLPIEEVHGTALHGKIVEAVASTGAGNMGHSAGVAYSEAGLSIKQYDPSMSSQLYQPQIQGSELQMAPLNVWGSGGQHHVLGSWPPPHMYTTASILGSRSQQQTSEAKGAAQMAAWYNALPFMLCCQVFCICLQLP